MTETGSATTETNESLGRLRLRVRGGGLTRLVDLTAASCRIGSAPGCTLRLRAPGVRDVHCLIARGRGMSSVRDLAGDTLLNGASFHEAPLTVGDCLRVGRLEVVVEADTRSGQTDAPAPPDLSTGKHLAALLAERQTAAIDPDPVLLGQISQVTAVAEAAKQQASDCVQQVAQQAEQWDAGMCAIVDKLNALERANTVHEDEWQQHLARGDGEKAAVASRLAELEARLLMLTDLPTGFQQLADQLAALCHDGEAQRIAHPESLLLEQVVARIGNVENAADELSRRMAQAPPRDPDGEERASQVASRMEEVEQTLGRLKQEGHNSSAALAAAQQTLNHALQELTARVEQFDSGLAEVRGQRDDWQDELRAGQARRSEAESALRDRLEEVAREVTALSEKQSSAMNFVTREELETCWPVRPAAVEGETHATESFTSVVDAAKKTSPPQTEESAPQPAELTFEPVSTQSPLSTAEVFQRLGTTVQFAEESPADTRTLRAGENADKAAGQRVPDAHARSHVDEEQESIDDYMARLLGRSRTTEVNEPKTNAKSPANNAANGPASFAPLPQTDQAAPEEPYRPRAVAPELASDMSAMRALANNTARRAIDRHHRKTQAVVTQGKLLVAVVALALSFVLMWLSKDSAMAYWSSIVALVVAVYWGARWLLLRRGLARCEVDEDDAQPTSETTPST